MFYPEKDQVVLQQKLATLGADEYAVVCFCAAWCRTCNGFKSQFEALAPNHPKHAFVWVDVEEHEGLLIDEDIEDFPTILIQNKKGTVYYGPLLPHTEHIERLLQQTQNHVQYMAPVSSFEQLLAATT